MMLQLGEQRLVAKVLQHPTRTHKKRQKLKSKYLLNDEAGHVEQASNSTKVKFKYDSINKTTASIIK
ncbi:hypothetical protein PP707_05690 [Acetobacter pasteurianus]|nr:hypothetical protein [Acetobacter pasteurianus]